MKLSDGSSTERGATALRECAFVPMEASEMIATAEVSGQLGSVLQTLGDFYENEGEQSSGRHQTCRTYHYRRDGVADWRDGIVGDAAVARSLFRSGALMRVND